MEKHPQGIPLYGYGLEFEEIFGAINCEVFIYFSCNR